MRKNERQLGSGLVRFRIRAGQGRSARVCVWSNAHTLSLVQMQRASPSVR